MIPMQGIIIRREGGVPVVSRSTDDGGGTLRGNDVAVALARTADIHDAQGVFQEVFLRYFRHTHRLADDEHRKAWLIRCTINRVLVDKESCHTVIQYDATSALPGGEMNFVLNRPFLFAIAGPDELPLFLGVVNTPSH